MKNKNPDKQMTNPDKNPDKQNPKTKSQSPMQTEGLLVARDLDYFFEAKNINQWTEDPIINKKIFRKLDATYYLWLYTMLARAKESFEKNEQRISYLQLKIMLQRFSEIHTLAVKIFGSQKLKQALTRKSSLKNFKPPELLAPKSESNLQPPQNPAETSSSSFVKDDDGWTVFISLSARALVDTIASQAKNLGWTAVALYHNKGKLHFPYSETYGLVCFIKPGNEIVEVTKKQIKIKSKSGFNSFAVTTFSNPNADQFWIENLYSPNSKSLSPLIPDTQLDTQTSRRLL